MDTNNFNAFLLSNWGNKVHEVLQVTRRVTVFKVYDKEAEAMSSFGEPARAANA
jgi:hypothetical protein